MKENLSFRTNGMGKCEGSSPLLSKVSLLSDLESIINLFRSWEKTYLSNPRSSLFCCIFGSESCCGSSKYCWKEESKSFLESSVNCSKAKEIQVNKVYYESISSKLERDGEESKARGFSGIICLLCEFVTNFTCNCCASTNRQCRSQI